MYKLTINDIKNYNDDGFLIIKNAFPRNTIQEILSASKEVFINQIKANGISSGEYDDEEKFNNDLFVLFKKNYNSFLGAAKLCQQSIPLFKACTNPIIISLLSQLGIKKPAICVKPIVYFNSRYLAKIQAHYKTPIHQDYRSMLGSFNSIVVWLPLVKLNKDLGPVEFIPGSHKKGIYDTKQGEWGRYIDKKQIDENSFVSQSMETGDMVIFSSFMIHRSGNNISNKIRWSIHFRYNDVEENNFINRNYPHPYKVYQPTYESADNLDDLRFIESNIVK